MKKSLSPLKIENLENHLILITLNRPEASNAFNTIMAQELIIFFEEIAVSKVNTRVVIITGAGVKAFCAGGDLKERKEMTDNEWETQHLIFERMIRAILSCPIPIIAAVNGAAFGGGCELATACDFIYATETAKFAQPETTLGIIPGAGGTQNLSRAIGERRAKEIIYAGSAFSAKEGMAWGLVNAVFTEDKLLAETLKVAKKIAKNAPIAIRQAKLAVHQGLQMALSSGLAFEIEAYKRTIPTDDRREGVNAFNEKRVPKFTGS